MQIKLREIQHFLYCPHRWGLMEIDMAWAENSFVVKANFMHERVHDPAKAYGIRGKRVLTSVRVFNDLERYDMYGVTDCIECTPAKDGVLLDDGKRYSLRIVEYKPTAPKNGEYNEADAMQVFAQKLCTDRVFDCDCEAAIYYADRKKRAALPLRENYAEYDAKLQKVLADMREYKENGVIPPRAPAQKCSGCSMKDLCMPLKKKRKSVRSSIRELLEKEGLCENC